MRDNYIENDKDDYQKPVINRLASYTKQNDMDNKQLKKAKLLILLKFLNIASI